MDNNSQIELLIQSSGKVRPKL